MLSKVISAAVLAATLGPLPALAASLREVGPPTNPPPASFSGIQFVDSRGCVFMRAGYGGVVKWVPRVDSTHNVLCGFKPTETGGGVQVAQAAPTATAAPTTMPMATVASTVSPTSYAAPVAHPAAVQVATASVVAPANRVVQSEVQTAIVPPKGYKVVWDDGRLNPMRGPRTAAGEEAMNQIWTRSVPARLIAVTAKSQGAALSKVTYLAYEPQQAVRVSTSSAATGRFVQIGTFGVPANAARVEAQLRALGLPVETGHLRAMQTVMVGPLAAGQVASALVAVHSAGFADAYVRD
ncbi:MAG: SPOR domain-containing protein [Paracoccaceae bacterium]|nr:SPOR domain-containing protein [Paracoccaceae bacterium]